MMNLVGQQLGNYRIIRLLGQGGFADVYLGQHQYLNTQAAIKVMHTRMSQSDLHDFLREAQTIAVLKHPHIVRILEFGVENSIPFLVMEAAQGTLRQRHPKGSVLPITTILPYVKQVASALQFAHDHKLIHQDVKPENMLVEANGDILLSDFGIAVIAHSTSSLQTRRPSGTPLYMAPELFAGKPRSASDQYALGIVVYEWLSGRWPFQGNSFTLGYQHTSTAPPLFERNLQIPSPVEDVVRRALAKDPQQRFPSVEAFAVSLEQTAQPSAPPIQKIHPPSPPAHPPINKRLAEIGAGEAELATTRSRGNGLPHQAPLEKVESSAQHNLQNSPTDKQRAQSESTMIQIARKMVIGLFGAIGCGGLIYIIIDIVQAFQGHSPPWWIWTGGVILFLGGGAVIQSVEEMPAEQVQRILNIIVDILFWIMIFAFMGSLIYFIINVIQAFLGHSPVWWVWVISSSAMPLVLLFAGLLSSCTSFAREKE